MIHLVLVQLCVFFFSFFLSVQQLTCRSCWHFSCWFQHAVVLNKEKPSCGFYFLCIQVLAFAIQKSDMDLRRILYSNIVLSGGSTLFKGDGSVFFFFIIAVITQYLCSSSCLLKTILFFFFAGFGDRLLGEVKKIAPKDIKIRVRVFFFISPPF